MISGAGIAEKTAYCLTNGVNPSGSRLSFCEFHADLHCRKNRYTFVPGRKAGITTLLLKEINNNGKKLSLTYDAVGNIVV